MGRMKAHMMAELEANPILNEQYWLNELQCLEPVLPESFYPLLELNNEYTHSSTENPLDQTHILH
jgi:hypothetical protein